MLVHRTDRSALPAEFSLNVLCTIVIISTFRILEHEIFVNKKMERILQGRIRLFLSCYLPHSEAEGGPKNF